VRVLSKRLACWIAFGIASGCLGSPRSAAAPAFRVQRLDTPAPFVTVALWAPPPGAGGGPFQTMVLLHGNQPDEPDRTWLVGLGQQAALRGRILIVPGLARDDYAWDRKRTARGVVVLIDRVARRHPVDRKAVFLVGYSAGGSRVLSVAAQGWKQLAGVASVAGDVGRPLRGGLVLPARLPSILLVCMSGDHGPNASCALDAANAKRLRGLGVTALTSKTLKSDHALRFELIAPLLDQWMSATAGSRRQLPPAAPR
jgi:poly(3-hydroxybutyrate) depolymerase